MARAVVQAAVPYAAQLETSTPDSIDLAVIHCTELPDLATAREYAERIHYPASQTGNCGHYYIDRDGAVAQWAPDLCVAHHVRGYNARSIGIELVNLGRYPDWLASAQQMREPYPQTQLDALQKLLGRLQASLPNMRWIAGHEDLDRDEVPASDRPELRVRRKLDPGPLFPWRQVLKGSVLQRFRPEG
jgi:N-acetylmuramoyl-L-alanine amidase